MTKIGFGYDVHKLSEGRRCVLCGVELPCAFGPLGHSDADVPVHALMDALYGALALGDIGQHFPDSDPAYKDADSLKLLRVAYGEIRAAGYKLGNADITIVLQKPKIAPYIAAMRESIAAVLCVGADCVSVKATTEETLGFTGDGSGIKAYAVVLLENS